MGQRGKDQAVVLLWKCRCYKKTQSLELVKLVNSTVFFPCSFHSAALKLTLPPLGGRMWVQLLFVSLDCPCANTAVMS